MVTWLIYRVAVGLFVVALFYVFIGLSLAGL